MVRRPRRPTHEDEPDRDPEHEGRTDDYEPPSEPAIEPTYDPEPAPEPVTPVTPVTQETSMPSPAPFASGNGSRAAPPPNIGGVAITPLDATSDQQAIIAQQTMLIITQAQAIRDLEAALNLSPPPPTTPPAPPATGVVLQAVVDAQTAAIRSQAGYIHNLQDLQTALVPAA